MRFFTEQGASHREVLDKIRAKYGERAKVMTSRAVPVGGFFGLFRREGVEYSGYVPQISQAAQDTESKRDILSAVGRDRPPRLNKGASILDELRKLREEIENVGEKRQDGVHPALKQARELLERNDFSRGFIDRMLLLLKRELSLEELEKPQIMQRALLEKIREQIAICPLREEILPRVFILVGPTGVGKTTTVAKLAAMYALGRFGQRAYRVKMVTIDNFRIGARRQIETYGEIMGIPVDCVETFEELERSLIVGMKEHDLIFVDTIGKSPRDLMRLAEMHQLLEACETVSREVHLAIGATTKTKDIEETLRRFEPFLYDSVVLTKLDETTQVGNIISVLVDAGKKISLIADGQDVPRHIEKATADKLLERLSGFETIRATGNEE